LPQTVTVDIRGHKVPTTVVPLPFYRRAEQNPAARKRNEALASAGAGGEKV